MDSVTIIVAALAAGAAAGLKPTAEQAIKDTYGAIKALIQRKYQTVSVEPLENKPESKAKQASVAEDLTEAGAGEDTELLNQAKTLLDALKAHDRGAASAIGVDLEAIEAEYLKLKKISATGTGVKLKEGKFRGGIDIENVVAGSPEKKV